MDLRVRGVVVSSACVLLLASCKAHLAGGPDGSSNDCCGVTDCCESDAHTSDPPDSPDPEPDPDAGVPDPEPDAGCCDDACCDEPDAGIDDAGLPDDAYVEGVDAAVDDTGAPLVDAAIVQPDAWSSTMDGICHPWGEAAVDVLFIGNSQIEVWNLPRIVDDLSETAPADCVRILPHSFVRGGANLRDLWEYPQPDGSMLSTTIATSSFDVIVIAESIDLVENVPAPFPALFVEYATRIINAARAAGAVPILYATPYIETPTHTGFHEQADPQIALGAEVHVGVAAGGLAWLRAWGDDPTLDLYASDRAHPGPEGSYLSSLVIWAAITGGNPIGLGHSMTIYCYTGPCPPISDAHAAIYQRAAWAQQLATGP